jgi:hypothetical protein
MITLKAAFRSKLLGDATLVALLTGPRVYYRKPPDAAQYPSITFFESSKDRFGQPGNGNPTRRPVYQFDVWTESADLNDQICTRVEQILVLPIVASGLRVDVLLFDGRIELYEDIGVHHGVMRYSCVTVPVTAE